MLEPFDQPLASGFGDSAGFMDRMGSEQNSAFDSFYKFLDNSGRLLTWRPGRADPMGFPRPRKWSQGNVNVTGDPRCLN